MNGPWFGRMVMVKLLFATLRYSKNIKDPYLYHTKVNQCHSNLQTCQGYIKGGATYM